MFNSQRKKQAILELKRTHDRYQQTIQDVTHAAERLHHLRQRTAQQVIRECEEYINRLANSPKEFNKSISELKVEYAQFAEAVERIKIENSQINIGNATMGAGVATGVGVAAFAPTAAVAFATTFGTASTGAAISALSGAAATNAALAWLGGGALAAGGGGMAAGQALLALAGPVGCGIGVAALIGGGILASAENEKMAEKARHETVKIQNEMAKLQAIKQEILEMIQLTEKHSQGVLNTLNFLNKSAPSNYKYFSDDFKQELATLINNVQAISKLLNRKIA